MNSMLMPKYQCHDVKIQSPNPSSLATKPVIETEPTSIKDCGVSHTKGSNSGSNAPKLALVKGQSPVKFMDDEELDEGRCRKKYFTAKYGQHQRHLIKKRINVETWIYNRIEEISKEIGINLDTFNIDLDDILDIEEGFERKIFLQKQFKTVYHKVILNEFITEILAKIERL